MQLWHWVLLFGLLFLITYNPRTGNLGDFFGQEISEGDVKSPRTSREAQSDRYTRQHSE
jgi:hypothetical protein